MLNEPLAPPPPPAPLPVALASEQAPPEGQPATPPGVPAPTAEQTAVISDLHWLIHQGHVIEFANGILETAKKPIPKPPKPQKKPEPKPESTPAPAEAGAPQPADGAVPVEGPTEPGTTIEQEIGRAHV